MKMVVVKTVRRTKPDKHICQGYIDSTGVSFIPYNSHYVQGVIELVRKEQSSNLLSHVCIQWYVHK